MRMIAESNEPSAQKNDAPIDWTPEQQMAHMLELCEAQMESALCESDLAVNSLIQAFTGLADTTHTIGSLADQLPEELRKTGHEDLDRQLAKIRTQMGHAIVAFQFYDKLTQRLGHVRYSLSTLAMFVCNRKQTHQREQWERLFNTLRRLYRTEEEREIFELMVNGASADEARAQAEHHQATHDGNHAGDVELF